MKQEKKKATRIVGIDFGLARIGTAISDESKVIASPFLTITTEKKTELTIDKILKELKKHQDNFVYSIEEFVIGLPLLLNGRSGLLADEVKHFAEKLEQASKIPIKFWDERLSSVQADRSLREGTLTRKERSKLVDQVSAVILLQSYLDYKLLLKLNVT